jgi:protein TonB
VTAGVVPVPGGPGDLPQWPGAMRYALPLCIVASLAAHLMALNMRIPREAPKQAVHPSAGSARTMQARLVSGVRPTAFEGEAAAMPETAAMGRSIADAPAQPAPPATERARASELGGTATTESVAAPSPSIASPDAASELDEYVPRPLLSMAPFARAPVVIAPPPDETAIGRHQGILSLFIDEEGRVQHIAADKDAPLPPAFEQAAREAFLAAQFAPGQIDGRAVKSRVRVEVVFDNTPLPETAPAPGR